MAAVVLTVIGFVLLEERLHTSEGQVLARTGATTYVFAGILGVVAEALDLAGTQQRLYPLVVVYMILAFLAQAAIGGALRQSGLLAPWIGWVTIVWNLAWLAVLPIITPGDIYFPHSASSHAIPDRCPIAAQSAVIARFGAADRATGSWCSALEGYLREVASGEIQLSGAEPSRD
jgi:hypothetical protein